MPTKIEKDSVTGTETTGHEWDGIKELNNPLPKWWLYTFYATIVWSIIYFVLYPSVPLVTTYMRGALDWSSRVELTEKMTEAAGRQAVFLHGIRDSSLEEILADPQLLSFARTGGAAAFATNCASCHGAGGAGLSGGYPVLADDDWLWGGAAEDIYATLLHGIRWDESEDTRFSEMPAFGDGILEREQVAQVADYVLSLSGVEGGDPDSITAGETVYVENCAACHGDSGEGIMEGGAPRLNDQIWLYGGERDQVIAQIGRPKHGVMPAWLGRLDDNTIKMLTVYVHSLGGGQ